MIFDSIDASLIVKLHIYVGKSTTQTLLHCAVLTQMVHPKWIALCGTKHTKVNNLKRKCDFGLLFKNLKHEKKKNNMASWKCGIVFSWIPSGRECAN